MGFFPGRFRRPRRRSATDSALNRREKEGLIRRVIRSVYDYPRRSKLLQKTVSPDVDQVAHALARKFNWRIQPDGPTAQNLLGLSTQVPAARQVSSILEVLQQLEDQINLLTFEKRS